ncbi:hypothetical protein B0H10DRAFT_1959366 [Mycena sp. CBHHK59/15]|nr:hypothetical protein B0H10DRAFT_1959366 [Mycena sp. CBHHK59/15]
MDRARLTGFGGFVQIDGGGSYACVAGAGIKRLDANMGAVSSRIEGYISDNDDRVAYLTANLKRVSDDVAATGLGSTVGPTFTASNMLAHPTILALITANNSSVDIIDGLRAKTASLRAEVTELHAAKRKRDVDEAPTYFVVGKLKWAGSLPKEHRRSRTHTRSPTIVHNPMSFALNAKILTVIYPLS